MILGARTVNGAIFMEASQVPNLVDRNFVWGTTGNGIYQHDCDELTIAQNFVGRSSDAGIRMQVCQGRIVGDRVSTARQQDRRQHPRRQRAAAGHLRPGQRLDDNLFSSSRKPFDLAAWQKKHGWDKHSVKIELEAAFDSRTLELTWKGSGRVPDCPRPAAITSDFRDHPFSDRWSSCPFATVPSGRTTIPA